MISEELVRFVESGVSMQVGTRDARLFPEAVRALGARVGPGRDEVLVFVPEATGARTVANLRDNGRVAFCCSNVFDHRTLQLKGALVALEEADAEDRLVIERYRAAFAESLGWTGLPPRLTRRLSHWPCHRVRFRIETVFTATPGPRAGEPLSTAATGGVP